VIELSPANAALIASISSTGSVDYQSCASPAAF
jgi:hypothetical protein